MTSQINSPFLSTIVETFPVAGVNNSSQGFRTNFQNIKTGLAIAGNELTYLQGKSISIIGDATGTSGLFGSTNAQPTPITLVLANTGVTAGTYSSLNNSLSIQVDTKGRIIAAQTVARPSNLALANTFAVQPTLSLAGTATSFVFPSFTFNEYGELTATATTTANLGLTGLPLEKGGLIVGRDLIGSSVLSIPNAIGADRYVLSVDPTNAASPVVWWKMPATPPVNPAQVIDITGSNGIKVVASDPAHPGVSLDLTTVPIYATNLPINPGTTVLMHDPVTNADYNLDLSRINSGGPTTPFALVNDPTPTLGGDLQVAAHKIISNRVNGLTLQIRDGGTMTLEFVQTQTAGPNGPIDLPEANWIFSKQFFPRQPPTFTPAEISAGPSAYMKIDQNGQMYWSKESAGGGSVGVTQLNAGVGIAFNPIGQITSTGSISIDYNGVQTGSVDMVNDVILAMNTNLSIYKTTIANATWSLPNVILADAENGSDDFSPTQGQLNNPVRSIAQAIQIASESVSDINYILLMPGTYTGDFAINKPNIRLVSLFGAAQTRVHGSFSIDSDDLGLTVLKGIEFDIANLTPASGELLSINNGVESLIAEDCLFLTDLENRPLKLITMMGSYTSFVEFNNCVFNGKVTNAMQFSGDSNFESGFVKFNNVRSHGLNMLCLDVLSGTKTMVNGAEIMWQAIHEGGYLELHSIDMMPGDFLNTEWDAATAVGSEDPIDLLFVPSGIISTPSVTPPTSQTPNVLIVKDVNLAWTFDTQSPAPSRIYKTGTCQYSLSNVVRKPPLDVISGTIIDIGGTYLNDVNDQIIQDDINGAYPLNSNRASTFDLRLIGNATLTLTSPTVVGNPALTGTALDIQHQAYTVKCAVKQTGAFTVTFVAGGSDTIIWDGGAAPVIGNTNGKVLLVEFVKINSTWYGRKLVAN